MPSFIHKNVEFLYNQDSFFTDKNVVDIDKKRGFYQLKKYNQFHC